jgi:hypothetical protein
MKKAALIFSLLTFGPFPAGSACGQPMVLVAEDEGAMEEAPTGLFEIGRNLDTGPEIIIIAPEGGGEYNSPLEINVKFLSRGEREVDLATLRVDYLKIITISLTKRVLPYTTKEGILIRDAKLPSGRHKIRVTIGDIDGGMTQETFIVKVMKAP